MMDVAHNKIAIHNKGIEVELVEPLQVEAEPFVRQQTAPLTGLNHACTVGPIPEQARLIDGGINSLSREY